MIASPDLNLSLFFHHSLIFSKLIGLDQVDKLVKNLDRQYSQ